MSKNPYPSNMLPDVSYQLLDNLFDKIPALEQGTLQNLCAVVNGIKEVLLKEKMVQLPELMTAQLCAYLGFLSKYCLGGEKATFLEKDIILLLEAQTQNSYHQFSIFPLYPHLSNLTEEEKKINLNVLSDNSPGSLVDNTLWLGREIFNAIEELNAKGSLELAMGIKDQTELYCPHNKFIVLLEKITFDIHEGWKGQLPILYVINQTVLQISWLMGYFAHMDGCPPVDYLKHGIQMFSLYINDGNKCLNAIRD